VRAEQSADRAQMEFVAVDQTRNLVKANPLFDWTRAAVVKFIAEHEIPCNALHDRGFLSIGCAPCTRAVHPDEPERAGASPATGPTGRAFRPVRAARRAATDTAKI